MADNLKRDCIDVLTLAVNIATAIATVFLGYAALNTLIHTNPPEIRVNSIHIWEQGKGHPLDPQNVLPQFKKGMKIEGTALAANAGRSDANIRENDITTFWYGDDLPMYHPLWGNKNPNSLKPYLEQKPDYPITNVPIPNKMVPGDRRRWKFETTVPPDFASKELYLIGYAVYNDWLGTRRGVYFSRKYDRKKGRFIAVDNPDYEGRE